MRAGGTNEAFLAYFITLFSWQFLTPVFTVLASTATITIVIITIVRGGRRAKREIAQEKREIAQEKREIAQEKREIAQEKREIAQELREKEMHEEQKAIIKAQENRKEEKHRLEMKILEQKLKANAKNNKG